MTEEFEFGVRRGDKSSRRRFLGYFGASVAGGIVGFGLGGMIVPGFQDLRESSALGQFKPRFAYSVYSPEWLDKLNDETRELVSDNNTLLKIRFSFPWPVSKVEVYKDDELVLENLSSEGELFSSDYRGGLYQFVIHSPKFSAPPIVSSYAEFSAGKKLLEKIVKAEKDFDFQIKTFDYFGLSPEHRGVVPELAVVQLKKDPVTYRIHGLESLGETDKETFESYWKNRNSFEGNLDSYVKFREKVKNEIREGITPQPPKPLQ
ncbi:hypothetical protein HOD75_02640 [archaeon]|jgi:hypothetical protein|nr:hypothetical protein [archaeon]MBT4241774.1 hypothetical protein [archaeon]MBT4418322.1 hypothetical protein [archaeon]